ncbi:MAG: SRPBCC family protein [Chloroflexi bacterium]|nr:SRPBCC family protein [Chloroflexota bacterium]
MVKLERTITINAPVHKVFDYLTHATNLLEIWPSLVEVKDVKETPQHVGDTFHWAYKMAGMRFEGESTRTEYVPDKRLVSQSSGGISSAFVYTFEGENGQTRFHEEIEYTVPVPLLGKLAESIVLKLNEHEMDVFVANLKTRMET